MRYLKIFTFLSIGLLVHSCATYKPQLKKKYVQSKPNDKEVAHTFYLIGDAGNSQLGGSTPALLAFEKELKKAKKNSTAIFLGDNIYEFGMPKKNKKNRKLAEHRIDAQINTVKDFKGKPIFIPGNHDWYNKGIKGLKRQEDYVEDKLGKNAFLPEKGCPIEHKSISDDIELIIID